MPKLSIITINYNNVNGLEKTMLSVLNQTWKDFEYIIIDGGSTDGSVDLIKKYENQINYWVSEPDKGIYNALNKGIKRANGEYLLFLNGDDCLLNDTILQKIDTNLDSNDLIYYDIIYQTNNKREKVSYPDNLTFYFFYTNTICHQAMFFKREIFLKYGLYDENLKIVSDWKFIMLSIIKNKASYKHIHDIFCVFDNNGISNTANNNNNFIKLHIEERRKVLQEEFPLFLDDYENLQLLKYYFKKYKLDSIKSILKKIKRVLF